MKRTLRILRRLLLAALFVGAAAIAAWVFLLPGFVEGRIRTALADAGLPDADFRLRELSLTGAVLTDVSLGADSRVTVGSIAVDYDLDALMDSRVRTITVTGLVVKVGIRPDGSLDLGPLSDLKTSGEEKGGALPFDRVRIRAARLELERDGETWRVPFDGEIAPTDSGLAATGVVAVLNREVRIGATRETDGGAVRATAELSGAPGESAVLSVSSQGDASKGDLTVEFRAERKGLDTVVAGHRVRLDAPRVDGRLELQGFTRLMSSEIRADFAALALDGRALGVGEIEVRPAEDGFDVEATLRRGATRATVFTSLPPLDLDRILEEDRKLRVTAELDHGPWPERALLPAEARDAFAAFGIRASETGLQADAALDLTVGPSGWSAVVEDLGIRVDATEVAGPGGYGVRDLFVDADLEGFLEPGRIEARIREVLRIEGDPTTPGVLADGHFVLTLSAREGSAPDLIRDGKGLRMRAPALVATFDGSGLAAGPIRAGSVACEVEFGAEIAGRRGAIVLRPGASLDMEDAAFADIPFGARATLLEPGRIAWGEELEWNLGLASVEVATAGPVEVGPLRAEGLEAGFHLACGGSAESTTGSLLEGTRIRVDRLAAFGHETGPVDVHVATGSILEFGAGAATGSVTATGRLAVTPFEVSGDAARAEVGLLTVEGAFRRDGAGLSAAGIVRARASKVGLPGPDVILRDVAVAVPLGVGDESRLPDSARILREGFLRTDRVNWRGKDLPPIAIDLVREGAEMRLGAKWSLTDAAAFTAEGVFRLDGGAPEGEVEVRVPRFPLVEGGRISEALTAATGYAFTGEGELDGTITLSRKGLVPDLRVRAFDATATSADGERSFSGIGADVRIRSFDTFETPGAQKVTFREAKVGEIVVSDGSLRFQIEDLRSILLERAEWRLGETGRFWAYAVRLDPQAPDVDVELFMENLSLADWLSVVTVDNATGDGRLYGRLRLQVRTKPRLQVTLGEGFLHAEGDGTISLKDPELARDILDRHLPDQGGGDDDYNAIVKDRISKTLEAFAFDDLKFDITESSTGAMTLSLHVAGRGREPPNQVLDLTVNVHGFEELIGPALAVKLKIDEGKKSFLDRLKIE